MHSRLLGFALLLAFVIAAGVVSVFGLDVIARLVHGLTSAYQPQAELRRAEAGGLRRVGQLLVGGAEGASGVVVFHAVSVDRR